MGAAAVPSASSLENMAGILIALLILLINAFCDAQKVPVSPVTVTFAC